MPKNKSEIVSITFDVTSHKVPGHFSVPMAVCRVLGLENDAHIALVIETRSGSFPLLTQMKSGTEVYGHNLEEYVRAHERIRVTAMRPPKGMSA